MPKKLEVWTGEERGIVRRNQEKKNAAFQRKIWVSLAERLNIQNGLSKDFIGESREKKLEGERTGFELIKAYIKAKRSRDWEGEKKA